MRYSYIFFNNNCKKRRCWCMSQRCIIKIFLNDTPPPYTPNITRHNQQNKPHSETKQTHLCICLSPSSHYTSIIYVCLYVDLYEWYSVVVYIYNVYVVIMIMKRWCCSWYETLVKIENKNHKKVHHHHQPHKSHNIHKKTHDASYRLLTPIYYLYLLSLAKTYILYIPINLSLHLYVFFCI